MVTRADHMNRDDFLQMLYAVADKDTSSDPENWTAENKLWGHCAVVALLAQDIFGGELLRAPLAGTEFERMRSHYWNVFTQGEYDFTESQFCGKRPQLAGVIASRLYVLSHHATRVRYAKLTKRCFEFLKEKKRE